MLAYKGIKKKDDLVRTLRERGYRDDLADPIVKWKNKDLVQALMKSDLERDGASMKDAGAPDDKGSDDEDCEDALERDGDNMEDAGATDDKGSDDEDSEDDNSNDEGDDEEAADNTTALGFLHRRKP